MLTERGDPGDQLLDYDTPRTMSYGLAVTEPAPSRNRPEQHHVVQTLTLARLNPRAV
jgi:hypothetical protein